MANFVRFFFFLAGLLGILILFMWFGTDHILCRNNYNLLLVWPMNAVAAFYRHSQHNWPRIYFLILAIFLLFQLGFGFLLPHFLYFSLFRVIFETFIVLVISSFLVSIIVPVAVSLPHFHCTFVPFCIIVFVLKVGNVLK